MHLLNLVELITGHTAYFPMNNMWFEDKHITKNKMYFTDLNAKTSVAVVCDIVEKLQLSASWQLMVLIIHDSSNY